MSFAIYFVGLLLIAAAAWAAASPLLEGPNDVPAPTESLGHERLRHQKEEALAAIRDAEFDRQLGKLSDTDYQQLRSRLEAQALAAMSALEREGDGDTR